MECRRFKESLSLYIYTCIYKCTNCFFPSFAGNAQQSGHYRNEQNSRMPYPNQNMPFPNRGGSQNFMVNIVPVFYFDILFIFIYNRPLISEILVIYKTMRLKRA